MKKTVLFSIFLIFLFVTPLSVHARESLPIALDGIEQYSKVIFAAEVKENCLNVTADAAREPEGYHSSLVRISHDRNLSNYGGMWVTVVNQQSFPTSLNLMLVDSFGKPSSIKTGASFLIEIENQLFSYTTAMDAFPIKPAETVSLYIPFSSLEPEGIHLSDIAVLGFVFTVKTGEKLDMCVKNISYLSASESAVLSKNLSARITGDSSMQIAVQGESISQLKIEGAKDSTFHFLPLEGNPSGLTLNPEGTLTSTMDAKAQTVLIQAMDDAGLILTYPVELYSSWRAAKDASESQYFSTPSEIEKPDTAFITLFSDKNLFWVRRIGAATIGIFLLCYLVVRRKMKREGSV